MAIRFGHSHGDARHSHPQNGIGELTSAGGVLFFLQGQDVWRTDGTADGTFELARNAGQVERLAPFGDQIVFRGGSGRLWRSDGTIAGTTRQPGVASVSHFREASGILYSGDRKRISGP